MLLTENSDTFRVHLGQLLKNTPIEGEWIFLDAVGLLQPLDVCGYGKRWRWDNLSESSQRLVMFLNDSFLKTKRDIMS